MILAQAGASPFVLKGNNAYFSGFLGIGTVNPQYPLDVYGDIHTTGSIIADRTLNAPFLTATNITVIGGGYYGDGSHLTGIVGTPGTPVAHLELRDHKVYQDRQGRQERREQTASTAKVSSGVASSA